MMAPGEGMDQSQLQEAEFREAFDEFDLVGLKH